jgi:hypothetical protein
MFADASVLSPLLAFLVNVVAQSNDLFAVNWWHIIMLRLNKRNFRQASVFY